MDGPGTKEPKSGPIIIKIKNFRGESRESYHFIDPVINDIEPRHGPQAGGTRVRIKARTLAEPLLTHSYFTGGRSKQENYISIYNPFP